MRERLLGFRRALQEAQVRLPEEWVSTSLLSHEAGRDSALHLLRLRPRPRALFVNNNLLSLGAMVAIRELGLRCPEDVAVLGFDDHPWAAVCDPPLTVVSQPAREIGQRAAETLCRLIDGEEVEEQCVELQCRLVVRESC
jgi:DNA-binding LacI/PurR family transcriptional regulator